MNEIVYLEPDNDIASVIGRMKEVESDHLALVIPRGGTIAQSIVNPKLIKRQAENSGKEICIVSNDKVSKNLASQVGISVYDTINEAKSVTFPTKFVKAESFQEKPLANPDEFTPPVGIKINRYNKDEEDGVEEETTRPHTDENTEGAGTPGEVISQAEDTDLDTDKIKKDDKADEKPGVVREKIIEKHITHEIIKEREPEEDKPLLENKNHNINPISPSEVEEYDNKMTPTYTGSRKNLSSRRKPLLIILAVFILAIAGLSYYLLPKAEATLTLKTDDLQANVEVTIDSSKKANDLEAMVIPGEAISVNKELSKDIAATGKNNVGTKASGEIAFYNYDYSVANTSLPANTELVVSGLKFITDAAVVIPGATKVTQAGVDKITPGTVNGKITAFLPGEEYNIGASKFVVSSFSGDKREKIYGQSSSKLTGGTTKEVIIIAEADITKAKSEMTKELSAASAEELNGQAVKEEKKIIASSLKDEEVSFDATGKAGDEVAGFKVTLKLKTTALAFSEISLRELINEKVKKDIGGTQMIVNPDALNIEYDVVSSDTAKGTVKILAKYKGKTGKLISKDDIILKIQGKKYGMAKIEAEKIDGVEKADIKIWPSILARVPFVKSRIVVNFGYQE